jgi:hypothetical protein
VIIKLIVDSSDIGGILQVEQQHNPRRDTAHNRKVRSMNRINGFSKPQEQPQQQPQQPHVSPDSDPVAASAMLLQAILQDFSSGVADPKTVHRAVSVALALLTGKIQSEGGE